MQKHCWIENAENRRLLVEMWSDYVNWTRREKAEKGWLIHQLNSHNCNKVFDAALGDGCDSIRLIKKGFCVTSNDVDRLFILKAVENAIKHKVQLKITNLDWRELNKKIPPQSFDAVLCLGNSFTCLFDLKSQIKAIAQFHSITKNGGILLIDERNYQHILDNRKKILSGQLVSTGEPLYCGKNIHSRPIEIKKSQVKWEFLDERTKKRAYAFGYPFKKGELEHLLKHRFQTVEQYSDYQLGYDPHACFYSYVCQK